MALPKLSQLSPQARRGLLVHLLQWQAVQVGSLFVSVYLFKLGHGYALPAWHALCSYVATPLGYWVAAGVTRRRGAGASLRLGLLFYALFQGAILALGERAADWAGSLGFLWGLGVGLYWQAWVLLVVDLSTEGKDRDLMLGANQACVFIASLTGAPLAGWYLSSRPGTEGYPVIFVMGLLLYLAAWLVSLPLKGRAHHGGSALRRLITVRKPAGWNAGIVTALLTGVLSVGTSFLPLLISVDSGGSERSGGGYTAFVAACGLLAAVTVGLLGHPERRKGFVLWSALGVAALTLPLALDRDYALVLVYGVGMAVAMGLYNVPVFAAQIRIVEASPRFLHRRSDAMLLREVPLNLGRILACAVVLWGVQGLASGALSLLLVALAFCPLAVYGLLKRHLQAA